MKKGAAKFQKDYNLAFEGTRRSSQLRGRPGTVFLVWFSGAGEGVGTNNLKESLVYVLTCLSSGSLMDQFMALTYFFTPFRTFSGLKWPPGQHLSKVFKYRSTSYSQLGQEIIDGASIRETEQPEKEEAERKEE